MEQYAVYFALACAAAAVVYGLAAAAYATSARDATSFGSTRPCPASPVTLPAWRCGWKPSSVVTNS